MSAMTYPSWEEFMRTSFAAGKEFPMIAPETPSFMCLPYVTTAAELEGCDAVIIGAPYVATTSDQYAGVDKNEWVAGPQRVRQQSARYRSGYIPPRLMMFAGMFIARITMNAIRTPSGRVIAATSALRACQRNTTHTSATISISSRS